MKWAYGITTVPSRIRETLQSTLASLKEAGFDKPRLFIDGARDVRDYSEWSLPITCRYPKLSIVGNWMLGMTELFLRNPDAQRFAMFQDDILVSKNLRPYLDFSPFPHRSFLNLYTEPSNEALAEKEGWYQSNQKGRGALGLVFDRQGILELLNQPSFMQRVTTVMGWKCLDGAIMDTLKPIGYTEYVHNPSLLQHIGKVSTLRNAWREPSDTFRGDAFDLMELSHGQKRTHK